MMESVLQKQLDFYSAGKLPAYVVATSYARLGQTDEALRYLQIAYQRHEPTFLFIRGDGAFVAMHHNPAFRKLLAQAGFPPLS